MELLSALKHWLIATLRVQELTQATLQWMDPEELLLRLYQRLERELVAAMPARPPRELQLAPTQQLRPKIESRPPQWQRLFQHRGAGAYCQGNIQDVAASSLFGKEVRSSRRRTRTVTLETRTPPETY